MSQSWPDRRVGRASLCEVTEMAVLCWFWCCAFVRLCEVKLLKNKKVDVSFMGISKILSKLVSTYLTYVSGEQDVPLVSLMASKVTREATHVSVILKLSSQPFFRINFVPTNVF